MLQELAHTWENYETKQDQGQNPSWAVIIKAYSPEAHFLIEVPLPKGSTTFQNSTTNLGTVAKKHESVRGTLC